MAFDDALVIEDRRLSKEGCNHKLPEMVSALESPPIREAALPITVEQYHRLGAAGIIPKNTELILGVIVEKVSKSPFHTWLVSKLFQMLSEAVEADHIRMEQPLTLADSEPEPDLAVVEGTEDTYRYHHPETAKLVIEVAITTGGIDREKAAVYAQAGIPEYWLLEPEEKILNVFTKPGSNGYAEVSEAGLEDTVTSASVPGFSIRLCELIEKSSPTKPTLRKPD